jgi:CRP-like cAMP-binding protein
MASADTVARLVRAGTLVENVRGTLLTQGERPSRAALVLSGTYVGTWIAPDGRIANGGIIQTSLTEPGQLVGVTTLRGAAVISGIEAVTPVTMVRWRSDEFRAITESDQAMLIELLDRCIYAVQLLNYLMQLRTFATSSSRLAGVLLQQEAVFFGDAPPVARGQLAAIAGVTPQMVSRIFRKWEAAAIVRRIGASGLELLDRTALQAQAAPLADFPAPDRTS